MSKLNKFNGAIALYFGFGSGLSALAGLIGTIVWLFKVFTNQSAFSWGIFFGITLLTTVLGFASYTLFRIGYSEVEK
ncbi:MAG: hypothetical protein AAF693_18965 [Bacteroidota bacterium]